MFSYIIPFHQDFYRLQTTLPALLQAQKQFPIQEILLCHNGPALTPIQLELVQTWAPAPIRILQTDTKGVGAAYRLGIAAATSEYVVLTASDLPFGFTDLQAFLALPTPVDFALGSKAHPLSECGQRKWIRRLATFSFRLLRKSLLGLASPGDTQGTQIVKRSLAANLAPKCTYDHYLFQLEMATLQIAQNGKCVELPVHLAKEIYPTNVHIWNDSWEMLKGILKMAIKYRRSVL